ncbi:MAG: glycosyltransferase family A protein [Gimesia sp.]
MSNFATLTFVGPGEIEARRLQQMLDSLLQHEPNVHTIVIIDDQSKHDFKRILRPEIFDRSVILENPRKGRGGWWLGGLCVGLTEGLRWLAENRTMDFVVRLDTDALVIAPFAERVNSKFQEDKKIGLLGTWDKFPINGLQRLPKKEVHDFHASIVNKARRHFAIWRHSDFPTRIQCSLFEQDRIVRRVIQAAIRNGYTPGYFIQGGGYAISGDLVSKLRSLGFTRNPLAFLHQFLGEDTLGTILCYAAKFRPRGFNQDGGVFGVQNSGLPAPLPELKEAGFAIVHSVKGDSRTAESEIIKQNEVEVI